jgi:hypothetical protein
VLDQQIFEQRGDVGLLGTHFGEKTGAVAVLDVEGAVEQRTDLTPCLWVDGTHPGSSVAPGGRNRKVSIGSNHRGQEARVSQAAKSARLPALTMFAQRRSGVSSRRAATV